MPGKPYRQSLWQSTGKSAGQTLWQTSHQTGDPVCGKSWRSGMALSEAPSPAIRGTGWHGVSMELGLNDREPLCVRSFLQRHRSRHF